MRSIHVILSLLFLLSLFDSAYSQTDQQDTYRFPGEHRYSQGKIYMKNNTRFEVTNLMIVNDQMTFMQKHSAKMSEYNLEDVQIIKVTEGTHAGEYAMYGGVVMGLSAALAVAQVESNPYPYRKTEINKGAWIGGFAAAGILIGGIAGSANPKWKTLYVNEQASLNSHSVKYALNLDTSINYIGLNLHFSY